MFSRHQCNRAVKSGPSSKSQLGKLNDLQTWPWRLDEPGLGSNLLFETGLRQGYVQRIHFVRLQLGLMRTLHARRKRVAA